jgi:hypothetical protein
MELEFLGRFLTNFQISNFIEIRSVGAELFHEDGQTDRCFHNFAKAPKDDLITLQTVAGKAACL